MWVRPFLMAGVFMQLIVSLRIGISQILRNGPSESGKLFRPLLVR